MEALSEINDKLKATIADENAQIRLVVQTGYDETGMIATDDGYLRLAQVLVEFVLSAKVQKAEKWDMYGHSLPGSTAINGLFRENHEVCIDTTMLAETEEEVSQIAQAFQHGSPPQEQPPDWATPASQNATLSCGQGEAYGENADTGNGGRHGCNGGERNRPTIA